MPVSRNLKAVLNFEKKLLEENKVLMLKKGKLITKQVNLKNVFASRLMLELHGLLNVPIVDISALKSENSIPFRGVLNPDMSIQDIMSDLIVQKNELYSRPDVYYANQEKVNIEKRLNFLKDLTTPRAGYDEYNISHMESVRIERKGMFIEITEQPEAYIMKIMVRDESKSFSVSKVGSLEFEIGFTLGSIVRLFPFYRK